MTTVFADITMTLDGFIAGPNDSPEAPLGVGGGRIHKWAYELQAWRERLGLKGGTTNIASRPGASHEQDHRRTVDLARWV